MFRQPHAWLWPVLLSTAGCILYEAPIAHLLQEVEPDSDQPQRFSGYADLDASTHAGRMYYWFFESRAMQEDDPLVLWISGGPGCSGTRPVFYETGPFRISERDLQLRLADWSWDVGMSMIYVDSPLFTGYSYSTDDRDIVYDEAALAEDVVAFLYEFLAEHPDMADRPLYLAGFSFAGHMLPNIALAVRAAQASGGLPLELRGVALGNPWIAPSIQYDTYGRYASDKGLIGDGMLEIIDKKGVSICQTSIDNCEAGAGREYCTRGVDLCAANTIGLIVQSVPGINVYDYRAPCVGPLCYDYSALERWLARPDVRLALGVNRTWDGPCSKAAHSAMMGDWLLRYDGVIGRLLDEGLPVLIYAGKYDVLCNYYGQQDWLNALQWGGSDEFAQAEYVDWLVDGRVAGQIRSAGPLSFILVDDAGHEVPYDVPKQAWHMINRFVRNLTQVDDRDAALYMPPDPAVLQPSRQWAQHGVYIGLGENERGGQGGGGEDMDGALPLQQAGR